ncbi:ROK family protein [Cohnella nanjingensis]|uniref:ROK family protein n=1 Tax=Cohnella nanjingensis TaxID=1387779 RepID=A0A7X0RVG5_9BACL|nr:ROK family protein [Cohnella nanjingensis]MBB6674417.1 ROK family protein [Cohnella nanjingensis]
MREKVLAGIDLGGTKLLAVIVDAQGNVLASDEQPTHADQGAEKVIKRMVALVNGLLGERYALSGVGVATAGTLNPNGGIIEIATNLGWRDVPLGRELERLLGVTVTVENDANAAAYGEWKAGAGIGTQDCVFITVSTGIGGGIVSGGKLVRGFTASAGELGHITIDWNGPQCPCGNVGCLELYASGTAIGRAAAAAAEADPARGARMLALAGGGKMTSRHASEAAKDGDPLAVEVLREAGRALGAGLVSMIHIANPELIILGGGASHIGEPLLGPMREMVGERVIGSMGRGVRIVPPTLGTKAGAIGAALMANA